MTLYMIGLGLGDKEDITLKGLGAIEQCELVFLENYTSVLNNTLEELEEFYEKKIILASRELVEKEAEKILEPAKEKNVAFLVVGDVFGATTHADLFLRAKEKKIDVQIINNASIINAVGITGLELYKFGKTTSIVFDDEWLPETPYKVIQDNMSRDLHTLCLLDIKVAEPSKENLKKGINKPEQPRFMKINEAITILKKLENKLKNKIILDTTLCVGVARLVKSYKIKTGTIAELETYNFGAPLHSLIIVGKLHEIEKEMLNIYK